MDEKEFLEKFVKFLDKENYDICLGSLTIASIDKFLKEHHKSYLPVYSLKLSGSVEAARIMAQSQAKYKMRDFFQFAGLEFTKEVEDKLEAYWNKAF